MARYGYIKKTDDNQHNESLLIKMKEWDIAEKHVYVDEKEDSDAFDEFKKILKEGDTVIIDSVKSMGDCFLKIQIMWDVLSKKKVDLYIIDFPLYATIPNGSLTEKEITQFAIESYLYIREIEKMANREKQALGIKRAREKGIKLGRRELTIPKEFDDIYIRWKEGNITTREATNKLKVDYKTFKKWSMQKISK